MSESIKYEDLKVEDINLEILNKLLPYKNGEIIEGLLKTATPEELLSEVLGDIFVAQNIDLSNSNCCLTREEINGEFVLTKNDYEKFNIDPLDTIAKFELVSSEILSYIKRLRKTITEEVFHQGDDNGGILIVLKHV